jgi:hypothetical protein
MCRHAAALRQIKRNTGALPRLRRLALHGPNRVVDVDETRAVRQLARQLASPLVLILVLASALSLLLRDWVDAATILVIVAGSALLGFWQELRASQAVAQLRSRLALAARVRRDGIVAVVPASTLVAGDVIALAAGTLVPADGRVIEAHFSPTNQRNRVPGLWESALSAAATASHSALALRLDRRARHGAIGAIDAAVTRLGLEHSVALLALVEPLAGVGGHGLGLGVAALRTGQGRVQRHGGRSRRHFALPTTVDG